MVAPIGCPKAEQLQQGWLGATLPRAEAGAQREKWSLGVFAVFWTGKICGDQGCWDPHLCCLLGSELRDPEGLAPARAPALQEA